MAIGLARMFNVHFPRNFDSPYKAQSVIEYWQRWHTTLTRYLGLYLYNPIALRPGTRPHPSGPAAGAVLATEPALCGRAGSAATLGLLSLGGTSEFLYFQF